MAVLPKTIVLLPTAFDLLLVAADNVTQNLLKGQPSSLEGPSLYRRAYQIVNATAEMLLTSVKGT